MKALRISQEQIQECARQVNDDWLCAEMAVPSYCHKNPFIRRLFWRTQDRAMQLAQVQSDETVLEFGCGTGVALPTLARLARTVYAADMDVRPGRHMARLHGLDNVRFIDKADKLAVLRQALMPGTIDCINAVNVLEHVEDPELTELIDLMRSLLTPRGRIIVSAGSESWLYRLGRIIAGFHRIPGYGVHNVFHHWNIFQIVDKFLERDFRVIRKARLPSWPLPLAFLMLRFEPKAEAVRTPTRAAG